ncbi:MAG: pectin esterase [Chitinophagaceae bacterium]|nr:MAG: pectin esterase [Chitinophagaceae bacterium]
MFKKGLTFLLSLFACNFLPAQSLVVAKDGSGQYKTVQAALNAVPLHNKKPVRIYVKNGTYYEKLLLDSTKDHVTLVGEDRFATILTFNDHSGKVAPSGDTINTMTSYSFRVKANHFRAENISFVNDAGYAAGQAVAVETKGDQLIFKNCRFIGNQDVLFTNSENSRQYFEGCYIEGTTDFIFGSATVWFEKCHIHSKKNSHITAASTPSHKAVGFVFNDCVLTGDTTLHNVSLGRPWRPYAAVLFVNSYLGPHIKAEGWSHWNKTDNNKTARYAEYNNYGPAAATVLRVSWSRQLTKEQAALYSLKNIMGTWVPK